MKKIFKEETLKSEAELLKKGEKINTDLISKVFRDNSCRKASRAARAWEIVQGCR
jgi:hypothetical protein